MIYEENHDYELTPFIDILLNNCVKRHIKETNELKKYINYVFDNSKGRKGSINELKTIKKTVSEIEDYVKSNNIDFLTVWDKITIFVKDCYSGYLNNSRIGHLNIIEKDINIFNAAMNDISLRIEIEEFLLELLSFSEKMNLLVPISSIEFLNILCKQPMVSFLDNFEKYLTSFYDKYCIK